MLAAVTAGSFFSFQSAILFVLITWLLGSFLAVEGGYRRPGPIISIVACIIVSIAWLFSIGLL